MSGYCLFNTTGTSSTVLFCQPSQFSVSFALLALASRLLTSSLHHSLPPLGQGIEHVALPVLSARFELARPWLYIATGTSTNLSMCSTCVTSTVFGSSGAYPCMFTEVSTDFVDELQLDESQRFCGRLGHLGLASATPLAHRSSCQCDESAESRRSVSPD